MIWLWIVGLISLSLLALNLWLDLQSADDCITRQRRLICRQSACIETQAHQIADLRSRLSVRLAVEARAGAAVPSFPGPSGPITLN